MRILITGAGGGIGQAVAERFASEGAEIVLTDRDDDLLKSLSKRLAKFPVQCDALSGDLNDESFVDALIGNVWTQFGTIDVLVNNAGIMRRGNVTQTSVDDYRASMRINVEVPYRLSRDIIPKMAKAGGGAIVNVASCWGKYPGPDHAVYCASKAAVASLTQCMGRDHAGQNIRVNAVCPNEVNTPMLRSGFEKRGFDPDTAIGSLNETVPLGRIAEPDDIADVIAFLASEDSRYLCGSLIEVNGGKPVY
ncbi:MAG: SDR family oxidoreductase [Pseudomonadota bacterium]